MDFTPVLKSFSALFSPSLETPKSKTPLTVLILSPHPDDESIIGSLALRLLRENGARVINVAVTLGSKVERRSPRRMELEQACRLLGIELKVLSEDWKVKERELKALLKEHRPDLVLAPHTRDHHPAHIKSGELLKKALHGSKAVLLVAWTEFWGQMKNPNLMVEVPLVVVDLQMRALEKHVGEIERNPYHLRLPAWMMDNVRRGSEIVAGKGAGSAQMAFGILYQLQLQRNGRLTTVKLPNPFLGAQEDLGQIFRLILEAASGSSTKTK